ncbi:hypothetical protein GPECTOR_5g398 [Gonium pectorale]|uniref:Uncharacterized protein n=1 Tax=Gonium pectorale TaxID=33097 RepID=A0A150GX49_GONPE|nr:hypothetical protein GPECTOR_5g398 [Gonium pectorale]|eukprot:KXZ54313.1 hypothetical protein GPECTOR_5g398 [Gonium pectorale]
MLKRRRSESLLSDVEPDVHISVHGRPEPLKAHYQVLSLYSKCVKELPRPSDGAPVVWDVSGLVPEGASVPFDAATVEAYLDLAYAHVDPQRRVHVSSIIDDTRPLLLFADAAASSPLVFEDLERALLSKDDLSLRVHVGDEVQFNLLLRGQIYFMTTESGLVRADMENKQRLAVLTPDQLFQQHMQQIPLAVCSALEEWLYLAGRLGTVEVARLLLEFARTQLTWCEISLCLPAIGTVYSPRVLQCMPPELLYEGFLRRQLTDMPTSMGLLRPVSGKVKVTFDSPAAATVYNRQLAASDEFAIENCAVRSILTDAQRGNALAVNMTVGGPDAGTATKIIEEVLEKAVNG